MDTAFDVYDIIAGVRAIVKTLVQISFLLEVLLIALVVIAISLAVKHGRGLLKILGKLIYKVLMLVTMPIRYIARKIFYR